MIKALLLLILTCGLTDKAFAADACERIDLRDQIGDPYDIGDTGWCFGHSTASLMSQVLGLRVSAFSLAADAVLTTSRELKRLTVGGAPRYFVDHPLALEDHSQDVSGLRELKPNEFFVNANYLNDLGEVVPGGFMQVGGSEDIALILANQNGYCLDEKIPSGGDNYIKYMAEIAGLAKTGGFAKNSPKSFVQQWIDAQCGGRRISLKQQLKPRTIAFQPDRPDFQRHISPKGRKILFEEIDANLKRGRVSAVGYDYCEHAAPLPPVGDCVSRGDAVGAGAQATPHIDHSAIIAARDQKGGVCKYFLRNHIGKTCRYYQARYQADGICEPDSGGIWLTRDEIKSIYSVISID